MLILKISGTLSLCKPSGLWESCSNVFYHSLQSHNLGNFREILVTFVINIVSHVINVVKKCHQ